MIKTVFKLFSQCLLLLAPMMTAGWSFLNYLGYQGEPTDQITCNLLYFFPLTGEKQVVEMKLRVVVTCIGVLVLVGYEFWDTYFPRRDLDRFRTIYLEQQKKTWRKTVNKDIRINIMHVRHPWYTFFIGRFYWTWNDGFEPPNHEDANMFLTILQGVAGEAYRAREPKSALFTEPTSSKFRLRNYLLMNRFHLWPWQFRKVRRVKYILSVPFFIASKGDSPKWKRAGVINLDTDTDEGAAFLEANRIRLVNYFTDVGKVIACLK